MKAVIYTRVSSDRADGRSVAEQEAECRRVCAENGWDVEHVLSDNDIGASRHSRKIRPAYESLTEILRPGHVLVLWEASRAQRDLKAYVQLRDLCAERGVPWCYSGTVHDLGDRSARFRTALDIILAEDEVDRTRERVMRALRSNAANGKPHGKIPYGYRGVRCPDTGVILERVIEESEAGIIREGARRILAGESLRSIVMDWNSRGIAGPTGRPWQARSLVRLLSSPTTSGKRSHLGVVTQGTWEPILTDEDQLLLRAIFEDPARITSRGPAPRHLLSGIAVCGICGDTPMDRKASNGTPMYMCPKFHLSINQAKTDVYVKTRIVTRLSDPSLVKSVGVAAGVPSEHREHLRTLQLRLDAICDERADNLISAQSFQRMERRLLDQIAVAEKRAQVAAVSPIVMEAVGPDAPEKWENFTIEQRRELVRSLAEVRILPAKSRGRTFDVARIRVEMRSATSE